MVRLNILKIAEKVINQAREHNIRIATAESCTGGMLSCYLTAISGSSQVFERGYVTYSNKAKREILSVKASTLQTHGAVSQETALEMVEGLLNVSSAHMGISITGIAGPTGGSETKPVGLVYIGYGGFEEINYKKFTFIGDRNEIRQYATKEALKILLKLLEAEV